MIERATLHNVLTCVIAAIIFIFQFLNDSISRIKSYVKHEEKSTAAVTADTIISSDSGPDDNNASKNCISVVELIQKRFDVPLINAEDEPKVDTSIRDNNQFSNFDNIFGEFMDHLIDDSYVARGLGLITATVGRQTEFYLYSKYDNNYEHVVIELKGRNGEYGKTTILNQIPAGFVEPKSIPIDYIYDEDRIKVTYTPLAEGVHTLILSRNGLSICRSPYYVSVEKSPTNSRSRVRLGTKKYKMVTKFGKVKQTLGEVKDNNIDPVNIESRDQSEIIKNDNAHSGSNENYITGTDVMSIVTKFESNNIGFKKILHSRMSSIAEKSPENDLIDENSILVDDCQKIETLSENYNTTYNVLDVINATEKICSNNVNRENTTHICQKSLNYVLDDGLKNENSNKIENPDQTTEQFNQKNNEFSLIYPIIDQLIINSMVETDNTNEPDSNLNNSMAQPLITDSTRYNISNPLAASIITKIKNLVCEKCSKRVFKTLSELPNDTNTTTQNTNFSEISSNCETALAQPMKTDINTANNVCEDTTNAIDKQLNNSPNLEQMDMFDKTITKRHSLNDKEPLKNNPEELCNGINIIMSTDLIFERNKFDCESSQILDKNIFDTIPTSPDKCNIEDINMVSKEYCSITEETASINSSIFNTSAIKNSKDKIELHFQNIQNSYDTDLIKSNNCEKNIDNALKISEENNLTTLYTDRLLLINNNLTMNESLDIDESKLIKSKAISNENSNVKSCIINEPVLASIKVPLASTEYKKQDHEQQTNNISKTADKSLIFATISDVNQKLIIEKLIDPILNNFKNNIVEQIVQLCLHENSSNTYFTQFLKNNTKSINDSREIQELQNTEHKNKQIENNEMLIRQEEKFFDKDKIIKTISDIKITDHNRLSEYVQEVIKKNMIPNENCVESMANIRLQKIVNIATHPSNQKIEFDKNETIDTLIEACNIKIPIPDNVKSILKDEPKYIKLEKYCNDSNITKDLLVKTPDVVNIATEMISTTEQYLEKIKNKDETPSSNDAKTIMVENTNIVKQNTASHINPISNLSDIVPVEKFYTLQTEDLSDGRILNDSQISTTNLQTTLTKLLNISKFATIKIPNTKNIDTMADNTITSKEAKTDGTVKPNTESTSEFSTLKNHENVSIDTLNTVEIKTINETLDNSNEIKIGNIIPMANNNETIDLRNTLELDTIIKSSISNKIESVLKKTDNSKSVALGSESRFKLPSLNLTEIIIVENVVYDTLISNCPVMITIEIEKSETKCSKVTITIPVEKPNTIVIENKSNTSLSNPFETILINEPRVTEAESYDTKNEKYETKCVSENASNTTNIEELKTPFDMSISNKNDLVLAIEDSNEADNETTKLSYYNETKSVKTPNLLFEAISDAPILIQNKIVTSKSNTELDNKILDKQLIDSETIAIKDQILKEIEIKSGVMVTSNDNKTEKSEGSPTIEKENEIISIKSNNIENISEHLNTSEIETSSWKSKSKNDEHLKFKNTLDTPLSSTTETIKIKNSNIPKLADLKNIKNQETYTKILKNKIKIINLIDKLMNDSLSLIEENTNTFDQNNTPESLKSNFTKVAMAEELESININILSQDQKPNETKTTKYEEVNIDNIKTVTNKTNELKEPNENIESIIKIAKSVDNRAILTDNTNEIKIKSITEDLTLKIGKINITPETQMEYDIPAIPIAETIEMESVTMNTILNNTQFEQVKEPKQSENETLHKTSLKDTDSIIFEKCKTVEKDVMSDISKSKCTQAISVEEREDVKINTESETSISNDSPNILVEEKMGIEIESISFDTISNDTPDIPIEVKNEIYTTENIKTIISISNNIPYVSEDKMMEKKIESSSKKCMSNDTQTTLYKKEIETISEVPSVVYSNLINKSEGPEIETISDPLLLNNDPTKSMEEPMKLKFKTTSKTSIKYDDCFVPRRKSMDIEKETVQKTTFNNTDSITFKELNTVETKLRTTSESYDILMSSDIETVLVEKLETKTIENIPKITDILNIPEENTIEIESAIIVCNDPIALKSEEKTTTIPILKDIKEESERETLKIDPHTIYNYKGLNVIDNQLLTIDISSEEQAIEIEETEKQETNEEINTITESLILNDIPAISITVSKEYEIKNTSETPVQYDTHSEAVKEVMKINKKSSYVPTSNIISNDTQDVLIEELMELRTETTIETPVSTDIASTLISNDIPATHVEIDMKKLKSEITTICNVNNIPTIPTDLQTKIKLDATIANSITENILVEPIREVNNSKIETISMITLTNDSMIESTEELKEVYLQKEIQILNENLTILIDDSIDREIKSTTTVLNDIQTITVEDPRVIETKTAPDKLLNDGTIVTLKEQNIVETTLVIQNPISIESQIFPVKEIEEVEIKNISEPPVQYDTYSETVEEVMKIDKESSFVPASNIISNETQDVLIEELVDLKTETTIETPVSTDISNIGVKNNTEIESVASTLISNDIPATNVEIDLKKLKSEITSISNVNNTPTIPTDTQTKIKVDATIANSITENILVETIEEVNNSKIETISIITLTNDSFIESTDELNEVCLQKGVQLLNENLTILIDDSIDREIQSTTMVLNDTLIITVEDPRIIETETAPDKSLNDGTIVTLKEPNTVETTLVIQNPICIDSQTFPVKEIEEVEIKDTSETPVQYDTYSEAVEEVIKINKESSFIPASNIISNDTQDVLIKELMELKTETPVSTDISNIAVKNNTEIESVASTLISNDFPATNVEIDLKKLKSEITSISDVNNTPTTPTDLQTKIQVDATIENSITENILMESIEEVNNSKIETISIITLTNDSMIESTEELKEVYLQKEIQTLNENLTILIDDSIDREIKSTTTVLNDIQIITVEDPRVIETETAPDKLLNVGTIVTLKEPNTVETILIIQNPISIDSQTFPVNEIEEVEIKNTSEILVSNTNITVPVKDAMEIKIESDYNIHLSNDTPLMKHNSEQKEIKISTTSEIPIQYIDNLAEPILETAEQFQTKIIHNILHNFYDNVNFVESEEIEIGDTTSEAPVSIEREIEHTTSEAPLSIEIKIEDTATETPVSIEKEMKIESGYVIPIILVDEPKRIDSTKNTKIPIIFDTLVESIESSKIVEIRTLKNNPDLNYKPRVLDENTNEIETAIVTDALLPNNYVSETINEQYAGNINTTPELVIPDNTSDILTETLNEIGIKSTSLTSISNIIQSTPIKESKSIKTELTYESLNNTVFLSSISNNILNLLVEEEPNQIETKITPETFISNETSVEIIGKPNRIKNKTVSETLIDDIVSFENPNLVQTEITMTNSFQYVSVEKSNEIKIENCNNKTPTSNVSPVEPINEIHFEGVKTLSVDQKANYNNTKLKKNITTFNTAFLDFAKDEQIDKTVETSYYDVLVSNNTDFVSKSSLLNISQTNVIDNSNAVNVNNTLNSSNGSEIVIIEQILDENKSIAKIQILNSTDTEEITSKPEVSNFNVTETIPLEIPITKDNMVTVVESFYKPNYDYTLITKTSDDSPIGELEEKNISVDDTINIKIVDDKINIENVYSEPKDIIFQISNDAQTTTGTEKSDISIRFSEYRETSKNLLSDDEQNLEDNLHDIQKLKMSMQCMQTSDEDFTEKKFMQLEHTEKMSMEENDDVMDDENKTAIDDKLYTVNESDLNAILCASSLQEALTLLDTKIKFKFKHKSKKLSSKTNLAMYKSCVETCTRCSDSGEKTSKFTEAQEFFKKIEEKSKK